MSSPARLVVLISGNGSNLQAVLDACQSGELKMQVAAVVSNQPEAFGLERARRSGAPTIVKAVPPRTALVDRTTARLEYDRELAGLVARFQPDWVLLAGWMRLLSAQFLDHFPGRVINLHPALPGTFPGTHAIERALAAFQRGEIQHTGVMVHLVPDEGVDSGPVLAQEIVPILPTDTLDSLEGRVHQVEHALLVATLARLTYPNPRAC